MSQTCNEQLSLAAWDYYAVEVRNIVPIGMLNDSFHQRPDCIQEGV